MWKHNLLFRPMLCALAARSSPLCNRWIIVNQRSEDEKLTVFWMQLAATSWTAFRLPHHSRPIENRFSRCTPSVARLNRIIRLKCPAKRAHPQLQLKFADSITFLVRAFEAQQLEWLHVNSATIACLFVLCFVGMWNLKQLDTIRGALFDHLVSLHRPQSARDVVLSSTHRHQKSDRHLIRFSRLSRQRLRSKIAIERIVSINIHPLAVHQHLHIWMQSLWSIKQRH